MSTTFPDYKGLNLPEVADEILKLWEENNIFEKSITTRNGQNPFVFFEGPPSANGLPGVHHVLARAIKDIFPRYKTMKGFQVKRKAGWDTHGLPIEMGVEKELGSIAIGKKANLFITKPIPSYTYLAYSFGQNIINKIIINGKIQ